MLFIQLLSALLFLSNTVTAADWDLVWSDEFDQPGVPSTSNWQYDTGGQWFNEELQFYTDRPENARVEDGHLVIEVRKEKFGTRDYTSARMLTRTSWTYGRFEVRAKFPRGRGTWPAIWMLPAQSDYGVGIWPDTGEIDIAEHVGHTPDVVHASVHNSHYHGANGKTGSLPKAALTDDFHVYAAEWSATEIKFFIDGDNYFTYQNPGTGWQTWPYDRPFQVILNVAYGGTWGGSHGLDESMLPQKLLIDYIRVYSLKP